MSALRKIILLSVLVAFALLAAVFAYGNREPINLDLGFVRVEGVSMAGAFAVTLAIGAGLGMTFAGLAYVKAAAERRSLRRRLSAAEAEVARLRSQPIEHAD